MTYASKQNVGNVQIPSTVGSHLLMIDFTPSISECMPMIKTHGTMSETTVATNISDFMKTIATWASVIR